MVRERDLEGERDHTKPSVFYEFCSQRGRERERDTERERDR